MLDRRGCLQTQLERRPLPVIGMVLAGIGHVDGQGKKNFLVVDSKTHQRAIEDMFHEVVNRKDICMVFITQACTDLIRMTGQRYQQKARC